ncbi:LAFE_0E03114g1_1 [Lachancea fermentati]|uniref:acid phosphatase n=1 Tax=Lachancea fermentati TaxID=4955 RepID=A0A1G4MD04_LACFM|nr:LAFE_0E03114g1_1 [Lachancea fermentati]
MLLASLLLVPFLAEAAPISSIADPIGFPDYASHEHLFPYMGGSGPHFSYPLSYGIPKEVPEQCTMKQIQLMARHGERYPTLKTGTKIMDVYKKISKFSSKLNGSLSFIDEDYEFFIQDTNNYEELTTFENSLDPINPYTGMQDAQTHAKEFLYQYGDMLENSTSFPIFTSNSKRVHDTANYFAKSLGDKYNVSLQIIDEDESSGANTLTTAESCSTYNKTANAGITGQYSEDYLKTIAKRLNAENKGLNLTSSDATYLFGWCAFETNVKGYSDMCDVFTPEEFAYYAYEDDLTNYYAYGPGYDLAKVVGSVNFNASVELLKQSEDLDLKVWLSFTHDNNIVAYLASVGLFDDNQPLPVDHVPIRNHIYHKSWMVPQGARVYTQLYECSNSTYVRYVVNDVVIPIEKCSDGPGMSCEFSKFLEYAEDRLDGMNYVDSCDITSTSNQTSLTFYWDYESKNYNASLIQS